MIIKLFNIDKKENSTKRPADAGTSFNCILKDDTSIINPEIKLDLGQPFNPSSYNYAYIPDFNRYYFINDWTASGPLWIASLSVDVLATFKDEIGDKELYILRSSAESDGYIADTKYFSTFKLTNQVVNPSSVSVTSDYAPQVLTYNDYFNKANINGGYFYVGIIGENSNGIEWICMLPAVFKDFIETMYQVEPTDMEDLSTGLAKKIANPIEYVVSSYWLPFALPGHAYGSGTIKVGYYTYHWDAGATFIDPVIDIPKSSMTFTLPKHPKATSRGKYLNGSPFTSYQLVFDPFGTFTLDGSLLVDKTSITCDWYTDINTGIASLYVYSGDVMLITSSAQLSVPIKLNQVDISLIGSVGNYLGNKFGLDNSLTTILSDMASSVVGGFLGADASSTPKVQSKGNSGNFLPFNSKAPVLVADFRDIADEHNVDVGRPLCKVRKPSVLGGYMIILDGSINASATKPELQEINNYLTGGFFYE